MSSPASRKRQRHRRSARAKLDRVESTLAERQADLAAYERVLADLGKRYRDGHLSPFSGAQVLSIVATFRDVTRDACARLQTDITELEAACAKLKPPSTSDPRTTLGS